MSFKNRLGFKFLDSSDDRINELERQLAIAKNDAETYFRLSAASTNEKIEAQNKMNEMRSALAESHMDRMEFNFIREQYSALGIVFDLEMRGSLTVETCRNARAEEAEKRLNALSWKPITGDNKPPAHPAKWIGWNPLWKSRVVMCHYGADGIICGQWCESLDDLPLPCCEPTMWMPINPPQG